MKSTFVPRHLGVWFTLTSRITEYEPARYFVDEQVTGPFASMRHEHFFLARRGHTQMVDIMSVEFRGGRLGAAVLDIPGKLYLRRVSCAFGMHTSRSAPKRSVEATAGRGLQTYTDTTVLDPVSRPVRLHSVRKMLIGIF
ncbi:hypothetical protein HQO84_13515 [Rhodococcus fascians]|nr:hypothetical protein [Rhodococcus fascians]MBY3997820.1 hypothetical protein [Rhodococcus fascians]MBY4002797.1 hypothetical protein [Rhodococcus fascians]MBY4006788.1 hypothetical protein [Rhodococcus fascians]MBY4019395.1 hypothetical protein [Rhodococcus fascians]